MGGGTDNTVKGKSIWAWEDDVRVCNNTRWRHIMRGMKKETVRGHRLGRAAENKAERRGVTEDRRWLEEVEYIKSE